MFRTLHISRRKAIVIALIIATLLLVAVLMVHQVPQMASVEPWDIHIDMGILGRYFHFWNTSPTYRA